MTHKEAMSGVRALAREFKKEGYRKGCVLAESALEWYKKLVTAMRTVEALQRKLDSHEKKLNGITEQISKTDKGNLSMIKRLAMQLKRTEDTVWKDLKRLDLAHKAETVSLAKFESKIAQIDKLVKPPKKKAKKHDLRMQRQM